MFNPAAQGSSGIRRASVQSSGSVAAGLQDSNAARRSIGADDVMDLGGTLPSFSSAVMSNDEMSRDPKEQKAQIET